MRNYPFTIFERACTAQKFKFVIGLDFKIIKIDLNFKFTFIELFFRTMKPEN
jgi:hypothetical protein